MGLGLLGRNVFLGGGGEEMGVEHNYLHKMVSNLLVVRSGTSLNVSTVSFYMYSKK